MNILQKRKMNSRLVRAAATEKTSSQPIGVQASSRRKVRLSAWRRNTGWRKHSDTVSEGGTTATASVETREGSDDDFFRRFHVTVVKTRTEPASLCPPDAESQIGGRGSTSVKKAVRFHKYDEVWNGGARNYVYSLYDREQQEESERDLADELDDVVGNMSHFFRCIKEGLQDVTKSTKHVRRSPPLRSQSHSSSEHDEDESFQSYNDDDEDYDSLIEESSV